MKSLRVTVTVLVIFSTSITIHAQDISRKLSAGFQTKNQTYGLGLNYRFSKHITAGVVFAPFSYNPQNQIPTHFYGLKIIYQPIEIKVNNFKLLPYLSSTNGILHYSNSLNYIKDYFTNDLCIGAELKIKRLGLTSEIGAGYISYQHKFLTVNYGIHYYF